MGSCSSSQPPWEDPEVQAAIHKCGFTSNDVSCLWYKFKEYDVLNKNMITIEEFIIITRAESEMFLRLIFMLFDNDMSGEIGFAEYLLAMYHFMSLDKDDLALFTFQIFDLDGGGQLEHEELDFLISVLWGSHESPIKIRMVREALHELNLDKDGEISATEFLEMTKRLGNILFPAFVVQRALRENGLGSRRWDEITAYRKKHVKSINYYDVRQINNTTRKASAGYAFCALKHQHGLPTMVRAKIEASEKLLKEHEKGVVDAKRGGKTTLNVHHHNLHHSEHNSSFHDHNDPSSATSKHLDNLRNIDAHHHKDDVGYTGTTPTHKCAHKDHKAHSSAQDHEKHSPAHNHKHEAVHIDGHSGKNELDSHVSSPSQHKH